MHVLHDQVSFCLELSGLKQGPTLSNVSYLYSPSPVAYPLQHVDIANTTVLELPLSQIILNAKASSSNRFPDLQAKSQKQTTKHAGSQNRTLRQANSRLGKALAKVIRQMANAIDKVKSKRESQKELDAALEHKRKSSKRRDEAGALKVEASKGRNEV